MIFRGGDNNSVIRCTQALVGTVSSNLRRRGRIIQIAKHIAINILEHPRHPGVFAGGRPSVIRSVEVTLGGKTNAGQVLWRSTVSPPQPAVLAVELV